MIATAIRQLPWMLALFVLGPIAGMLVGALRAPDGSGDATLLVSTNPVAGIIAGAVTLVFALVVGLFGAQTSGSRSGLNAAGIVFAWAAASTSTIDAIIRRAQSGGPLTGLAIEGLVVGLLAVPILAIVWRAGLGKGQHGAIHPLPEGSPSLAAFLTGGLSGQRGLRQPHESLSVSLFRAIARPAGLVAILATIVAGAGATWLVCQDMLKGQAIFAAALTGVVAVPVGRLAAESIPTSANASTREQPPIASFALGFALLALLGPFVTNFMHGPTLVADTYAGDLVGIGIPVTLDWIAGACIGLPIGEAWFHGMFKAQGNKGASPAAATGR